MEGIGTCFVFFGIHTGTYYMVFLGFLVFSVGTGTGSVFWDTGYFLAYLVFFGGIPYRYRYICSIFGIFQYSIFLGDTGILHFWKA